MQGGKLLKTTILAILTVLAGCALITPALSQTGDQCRYLEDEIQKLRSRCQRLEAEIQRLEAEKEQRNLVDYLAHKFVEAMVNRDFETMKQLASRTVFIGKTGLAYASDGRKIIRPFPEGGVHHLRQRGYELTGDGRFITVMEFYDDKGCIGVFEMVFVKENGTWKVAGIANDI